MYILFLRYIFLGTIFFQNKWTVYTKHKKIVTVFQSISMNSHLLKICGQYSPEIHY